MGVIIDKKYISNIPTLEIYGDDNREKKPLAFIIHGLGNSKEANLEQAYMLAQHGFFVVSFDAYMHGEQKTEEFQNKEYIEKFLSVFDIVMETTKYIDKLIRAYKDNRQIDINRIGLIGISMGGFILYNYLANNRDQSIRAAASIISSPDWSSVSHGFLKKNPQVDKYFNEEKLKNIESMQPINLLKNMRDFPLLMLNGDEDELVPIEGIKESFNILEKNYINKDMLKLINYKRISHEITPKMSFEACQWLKRFV